MRRWISQRSPDGDGAYWCLYDGAPGDRMRVATVCKFVTRWRGYLHAQRSADGRSDVAAAQRSPSQGSAHEAAHWVVERLAWRQGDA